ARPMSRLIQDTIRRALADELLFGRLANGGKVTVDVDESDKVHLLFAETEEPDNAAGDSAAGAGLAGAAGIAGVA
ncbi:MAG: hypothetical protein V4637_19465, partial [Pseudomonadota bacterium]